MAKLLNKDCSVIAGGWKIQASGRARPVFQAIGYWQDPIIDAPPNRFTYPRTEPCDDLALASSCSFLAWACS